MVDISQKFGDTTVLHGVNLSLAPGEIHALVGQNGAGKSTLTKILGGIYPEHEGRILIDGDERKMASPREALRNGVGTIYQELSLIPSLTVAENILLGMEPGKLYSRGKTTAAAADVISRTPMLSVLPLEALAGDLSTGMQQRVEIAKALSRNVRVLVMDEPTARLSGPERTDLRDLMIELANGGITIIYISHFLEEIFDVCSSVTVLRNGKVVDSGPVAEFTLSSMTRAMLNAELAHEELDEARTDRAVSTDTVLELEDVAGPRISGINLRVHAGEVVGIAGLVGSGRTRLAKTMAGAEPNTAGRILLGGRPARIKTPRGALQNGIVLIPESRKTEGIVGIATARSNMIGMALDRGYSKLGIINRRSLMRDSNKMFTDLEIRPESPSLAGQWFSGGNQQKLLLARALLAKPAVIIADQPTAGVDVGTKAQIHRLLKDSAAAGTALVVVSDDLDELLALCDRVVVMSHGRIMSEHNRSQLTRKKLVATISSDDAA
ncbi:sugar ABC transporter ATP-binding protein [Arthrobacter sp. NPDC056691]|uniref:sugar ABC transporter ATP-binding protein n=1 Tax=Arthrobacter sp. NPDC056691 TaxID=3345913 RepID=UPI0036702E0D